jgi:DNA-binding NarL/FixJ family response regulator
MAGSTVKLQESAPASKADDASTASIRVILADSQTIFRVGLRKVFALEDDLRVVGQAESYGQAIAAIGKFEADVILFEAALAANPAEAISELLRRAPTAKLVVLTNVADEEETLEFFRRGAHGIVERAVGPEELIDCLRKVAQGELWLQSQALKWVLNAYRTQGTRPMANPPKVHLTQKELLIVSCVAQGMKNKEIAQRVNTTEQVVKNYLRKVYDKLGVSDRLELALYCLHHRLLDGTEPGTPAEQAVAAGSDHPPAHLGDKVSQ